MVGKAGFDVPSAIETVNIINESKDKKGGKGERI